MIYDAQAGAPTACSRSSQKGLFASVGQVVNLASGLIYSSCPLEQI